MGKAIQLKYPRMFQGNEITHLKLCAIKIECPRIRGTYLKRMDIYLMPGYYENGVLLEPAALIGQVDPVILNDTLFDELMVIVTQGGSLLEELTAMAGQFLIDKDLPTGWNVNGGVLVEC